jgi:hypothetical protein
MPTTMITDLDLTPATSDIAITWVEATALVGTRRYWVSGYVSPDALVSVVQVIGEAACIPITRRPLGRRIAAATRQAVDVEALLALLGV